MLRHKQLHKRMVLVLVMAICCGPASARDWPTYRGHESRSGTTEEQIRFPLPEKWVHESLHAPSAAWPGPAENDYWHHLHGLSPTSIYDRCYQPVIVGKTLYFGSSSDDAVYCLDAESGAVKWTFVTDGPVRLAPTVDRGRVYVGSDDGRVYCLDALTGHLIWNRQAGPEDRRLPSNGRMASLWPVRTGIVLQYGVAQFAAGMFPLQGSYLVSVQADTGELVSRTPIDVSAHGYMVASPTRLLIPTGRSAPAAFDRKSGKSLGGLGNSGGSFALVLDDVVVHGGDEKGEISIDDVRTQERLISMKAIRMTAHGGIVYFLREGTLTALDRDTYLELSRHIAQAKKNKGEDGIAAEARLLALHTQREACTKWTVECDAPYEMIVTTNAVFVGGTDKIVAHDVNDGKVLWTGSVKGKAYGLAVSGGRVYASTDRGTIHCFAPGPQVAAVGDHSEEQVFSYPTRKQVHMEPEWPERLAGPSEDYASTAEWLVSRSDTDQGYCVVLDAEFGQLAYEIAKRSRFRIICVEDEVEKIATARRVLMRAGLYGDRIVFHPLGNDEWPYPKYFANLITSDAAVRNGEVPTQPADHCARSLRPHGGMLAIRARESDALDSWLPAAFPRHETQAVNGAVWGVVHRGPLPGAGEWTHTYAEPGNTACSGDELVYGDMDLLWFGRPGPRYMIDRHHRNVPPLYKDGRCFIPGDCVVFCVDAYNGTILWKKEVPNSRRLGVFLDSSNLAVHDDALYWAVEGCCLALDARTGRQKRMIPLPTRDPDEPRHWSYLAHVDDMLVGSACKPTAPYTETSWDADRALWGQRMEVVTSDYVFGMNRATGETLWKHGRGRIINTTLTLSKDRVFFVETFCRQAIEDAKGRRLLKVLFATPPQKLVGLDLRTGEVVLDREIDTTNLKEVCYLCYSDDVLLLSGSKRTGDSVHYQYDAFDARSGEPLWEADHDTGLPSDGEHGEYNRHPTIVGDQAYCWPYKYHLKTGTADADWNFSRLGHGCGGVSASICSMFWRGNNPWMYDLTPGGGPLRLTKTTRLGCWINAIPAGGLVLIPEASSGCTCAYPMQASMAFVPAPPAPRVNRATEQFVDACLLTFEDPTGDARIHYSTDGSEPTLDSARLTHTIKITETTLVKARSFWPDGTRSSVFERTFRRVEPRPGERVQEVRPGLRYVCRAGEDASRLEETEGWTVTQKGSADACRFDLTTRPEHVALSFVGYVTVPEPGVYTFYVESDDGSRLSIGGEKIIDNDGLHGAELKSGSIALAAGLHAFNLDYFQNGGGSALRVMWEGPDMQRCEMNGVFVHAAP